jgi:hypothetical protein
MRHFLIFSLAATLCNAATVSVCATGCTTTSLQTALDSLAACGDTIQIKSTETQPAVTITYRGCGFNPITVTSDRAATWLPNSNARATPSQLGNMAVIAASGGTSALAGVVDVMGRPPAGWDFIGVAFTNTNTIGGGSSYLVDFNGGGTAANSTQIANNITFDRCYFYVPSLFTGIQIRDMIRGDVTNLTVKNSFFGDGFILGGGTATEAHGIRMLTTPGPITVTNNFITTSASPVFVGGAVPSYATYLANGLTGQYNYTWRPWKWNGDPTQPYAADYVTAGQSIPRSGPWTITNVSSTGIITTTGSPPFIPASLLDITSVGGCTIANANNWRNTQLTANTFQLLDFPGCNSAYTSGGSVSEFALTVCTKNHVEFKWGTGITWQYNVGENSWGPNQCGNQFTGFTDTLRTQWENPGVIFSFTNSTHITWAGAYRIATGSNPDIGDMAACISLPTTGTECHPITSYSGASMVTSAFSAAPAGTFNGWISYTGSAQLENVIIQHNVWKNVDQPFSNLALSFASGVSDAGLGKTHTITQNLAFANTSYITGYKGLGLLAGEADYNFNPSAYTFDHNTVYSSYGFANGSFVYTGGTQCNIGNGLCSTNIQPQFAGSAITNNLFGVSSSGGNGPFSGDGVNNIIDTTNAYFATSNIKNNVLPGAVLGSNSVTGGNAVSGNILTWTDPFGGLAPQGIFKVTSVSPYHNAATDGTDLGADFTQLPMVNNVAVAANILGFDVTPGVNSDVKATQPCVLEVSSNRNLISDLGTYSVIASLDPTVTIGADLSTRSDVTLVGSHVTWPLAGVTGGTTYYLRLQCYGDMEMLTFTAVSPSPIRPGKSFSPGNSLALHLKRIPNGLSAISHLFH